MHASGFVILSQTSQPLCSRMGCQEQLKEADWPPRTTTQKCEGESGTHEYRRKINNPCTEMCRNGPKCDPSSDHEHPTLTLGAAFGRMFESGNPILSLIFAFCAHKTGSARTCACKTHKNARGTGLRPQKSIPKGPKNQNWHQKGQRLGPISAQTDCGVTGSRDVLEEVWSDTPNPTNLRP